jgi:hypothetical protein
MRRRRRKCLNCKELFLPCPSARDRQKHCSKPQCQRARKAANNRAFAERNPDYWQGRYHVERTRRWRRSHPRYWRREKRNGGAGRDGARRKASTSGTALQVELVMEQVDSKLVAFRQDVLALQAVSEWHRAVVQGLASYLTGCALQAELGSVLTAWYDKGMRVGGGCTAALNPSQQKEPNADENPARSQAGPAPSGAGELQLGRSPPCS